MDKRDRKDNLQEAMELLELAVGHIKTALKGTSMEGHANAYIIPHLNSWIDSDNSFNMGIQQYIERLEEEEDEFED